MSQGPLCPNLTQKVQKEVSQMANRNLPIAMLKMKTLVTSLSLYGSQYNQMGKHISLNDQTTQKSYLSGDLDFIHLCL